MSTARGPLPGWHHSRSAVRHAWALASLLSMALVGFVLGAALHAAPDPAGGCCTPGPPPAAPGPPVPQP